LLCSVLESISSNVTPPVVTSAFLKPRAASLVATEKNFRKLTGYKLLWMLKAYLDESSDGQLVEKRNVG
jgi:hypothetical protein